MADLQYPSRDPADVDDIEFNWTTFFSKRKNETLVTAEFSISPPGELTVQDTTLNGYFVTAVALGGVTGTEYTVTCTITTNLDFTYQRSATVLVEER